MTTWIRYILIGLIVVMLSALGGWYLFLKGEKTSVSSADTGRGLGLPEPFGKAIGSTYENIVSSFSSLVGGVIESTDEVLPQLSQVGKSPTAGYGFVGNGSDARLRFVERGTGYVFAASPETGILERMTNTLVPRTYEAHIRADKVVMRSMDEDGTVTTTLGEIALSTSSAQTPAILKQRRLVDGIRAFGTNPNGTEIFYILDSLQGGAGIRASWDETKQKKIFSSAILGWNIDFVADGRIFITEKATDGIAGSSYLVRDNALTPIVRGITGLTFLPRPESSAYLFGTSELSLFAQTAAASSTTLLPIRTIANKCVWAPAPPKATQDKSLIAYCAVPQQLPARPFLDRWYRGETHTSDAWWRVNVSANVAEPLYSSANAVFDVEDPLIDEGGKYIAFRNAIDKTLWLLRISEE